MKDFIIVGQGLAANIIAHTLHKHEISFTIIGSPELSSCSEVAAGIWNPIVFKGLTKSWLADEIVPFLENFYSDCETKLGKKLLIKRDFIKPFVEEQEKNLWINKSKNDLKNYLDQAIYSQPEPELENCIITNEYGKVKQGGNVDIAKFLELSRNYFKDNYIDEFFDYQLLKINSQNITYKNINSKNIIFCEGHLVKNNPYFSSIPLKPVKGELLTIHSEDIKFNSKVFSKNGFLMDMDEQSFKVGSTYNWNNLDENTSEEGLKELTGKLEKMIFCNYSVINHQAGIRPSSIDRRPIIGPHPLHKNLFVFNGLGTKGVMLAPYLANNFVNFYFNKQAIIPEVDTKRFYSNF
jgi:glycine oxidase